jgi:5-methylcytosine-specific restriction enzyme A
VTRFWTCHWQNRYWRDDVNAEYEPVCFSGSNSFRKRGVSVGDVVYIVSLAEGQLLLGGRMMVKRIVSREEAVRIRRHDNLFEAREWIIDEEQSGTPLNLHRRLAPAVSRQLRFVSPKAEPKELFFISDTHLDNQATRGVRELTRESAVLLDRIIEITDQLPRSGALITVTEEMLRDGFNPSIDRYDRRSVARLFRRLWPDPDVSLACAKALAASIRIAHEASDACWEVTMFPDAFRLNVGQVEALTLATDEARFLFRAPLPLEDASPVEVEIGSVPYYRAVPVPSGVCYVGAEELPSLPSAVRESHNAYIRAAASFKRVSPFKKSFSPAVLEYLEAVLATPLPRPSYLTLQERVEPLPDEIDSLGPIWEGARYHVTVNAYERNSEAKRRCKEHYGTSCYICGFSFGAVYGEVAEGYIHVHHLRALSEIGGEYVVNPVDDLRPVCPNCHAVIHLGGKCRTIEEVRQLLGRD